MERKRSFTGQFGPFEMEIILGNDPLDLNIWFGELDPESIIWALVELNAHKRLNILRILLNEGHIRGIVLTYRISPTSEHYLNVQDLIDIMYGAKAA